ncbi:MAG: succinate--CoA ligase [Pseudolabrys sp.]|nr:succinate--CoA ligase [Pseudolabrys sp.]
MIRLLEHEGKDILRRHGIDVPAGGLFPDLSPGLDGKLVVKAQLPSGGRGKAGGIRFVDGRAAALRIAERLLGETLGGAAIEAVYVEQRLDIAAEYYVAATVNRDRGVPVLLASAAGGVEIESVPPDRVLRQEVDPLIGLQPFMIERLVRGLGVSGAPHGSGLARVLERLYAALIGEDAELVEINPLARVTGGGFVAADAKVVLDEDAAFRHFGRRAMPAGTAFETAARGLDVIGVECGAPGGAAAIMNGAGLTMATMDELLALGGALSGLVELHGATMHGPDRIADVLACALRWLAPSVILVNIHFQFRSLDVIAEGVVRAMQRLPSLTPDRLVLRIRGEKEDLARTILEEQGLAVTASLRDACAVTAARSRGTR